MNGLIFSKKKLAPTLSKNPLGFLDNEHINIKDWISYTYVLSENFLSTSRCILDINLISYKIRINKKLSQGIILFFCNNGYPRKINISTKKLYLKNKIICLSNFNDIYDELKHLELILKIHMSN